MDDLRNFNAPRLYKKLALPDQEFELWFKELGLLHTDRICECGGSMNFKWR